MQKRVKKFTGKRPLESGRSEVIEPDTSNSSYETVTNADRHCRNCSWRTLCRSLHRNSQNLHTRTSDQHPTKIFIQAPMQTVFKILMQGPLEDFNSISTWCSHKDLHQIMQGHRTKSPGPLQELFTRTCTRSCKGLWHKIFAQGFVKDLEQDLHATPRRISRDCHKRTCCCSSGSYKILIQEPPKSLPQALCGICKLLMQGPLSEDLARISTRFPVKDLYRIMQMQGPLKEELSRISTRACLRDNLKSKCRRPRAWEPWTDKSQEPCYARIYRKMQEAR